MGLIKAGLGAVGGVLADQWKEYFYCDALDMDTLVVKGQKRVSKRSSNTKGSDNVISNGSGIAVADGQCMMIVEQGKVVEVCAEPGEYTYDSSLEPSIFTGSLGESIKATFKEIGKRFTFGGRASIVCKPTNWCLAPFKALWHARALSMDVACVARLGRRVLRKLCPMLNCFPDILLVARHRVARL